jgi:putative phage-type endonuclease
MEQSKIDWLKARKNSIGGSESAVLLGLSQWTTPLQLYLDKINPNIEDIDSIPMRRGRMLEPLVKELFKERTQLELIELPPFELIPHPTMPFISATPDGLARELSGDLSVVECKTAVAKGVFKWLDGVPINYQCQAQHYAGVFGCDKVYIAALLDDRYCQFEYARDDTLIDTLYSACKRFWYDNVLERVPPKPINYEDSKLYWKHFNIEEPVIATNDVLKALKRMALYETINKSYSNQISNNKREMENIRHIVVESLKGATELIHDDIHGKFTLATYRPDINGNKRLNLKRDIINSIPIDINGNEIEQIFVVSYYSDNVIKCTHVKASSELDATRQIEELFPDLEIISITAEIAFNDETEVQ